MTVADKQVSSYEQNIGFEGNSKKGKILNHPKKTVLNENRFSDSTDDKEPPSSVSNKMQVIAKGKPHQMSQRSIRRAKGHSNDLQFKKANLLRQKKKSNNMKRMSMSGYPMHPLIKPSKYNASAFIQVKKPVSSSNNPALHRETSEVKLKRISQRNSPENILVGQNEAFLGVVEIGSSRLDRRSRSHSNVGLEKENGLEEVDTPVKPKFSDLERSNMEKKNTGAGRRKIVLENKFKSWNEEEEIVDDNGFFEIRVIDLENAS